MEKYKAKRIEQFRTETAKQLQKGTQEASRIYENNVQKRDMALANPKAIK